jgi:hypothetical protein
MSDVLIPDHVRQWSLNHPGVFVVGSERSGTSVMFRTLSQLQGVIPFPDKTPETFVFIRPARLLFADRPDYELATYLHGKEGIEAFLAAAARIREVNTALTAAGRPLQPSTPEPEAATADDRALWQERHYRDLIRAFFWASSQAHGRRRVIEKTPAHVRSLRRIHDCFPSARIVACVRDPVDIIASHKRRLAEEIALGRKPDDPALAWLSHGIEAHIGHIRHIAGRIAGFRAAHPDRILVCTYERFTADPAAAFPGICAFLNAPFDPAILQAGERTGDAWDPLLAKPVTRNDSYAERYLTAEDIARVRSELADVYHAWDIPVA